MRREELHNKLRRCYKPNVSSGVARVADPAYKNLWFVVPPPPPTVPPKNLPLKALTRANGVINQMPTSDSLSEIDQVISYLFVRREALTSSRMEGTISTIDHVLTPPGIGEDALSYAATAAVRGYAEALEKNFALVQKRRYAAFTTELVTRLHKLITEKDPNFHGRPGKVRSPGQPGAVVLIGGLGRKEDSVYNPAPPEQVKRCLEETMAWFRDDLLAETGDAGIGGMPITLRLAIGHAHFEAVHPFSDGNGRVGRMLWPFQMSLAGMIPLYLSGFVEAEKHAYYDALGCAQKKLNYSLLIEFVCEAIVASYGESRKTKEILTNLPKAWRARGAFRKGSAAERCIDLLIKLPILTAKELAASLNTSFAAASNALNALAEKHIVRERTGHGRNRVFAAEEVLCILGREFGENPALALDHAKLILGG